jgi:type IV pilus assembly protein PilM
MAKKVTTLFIRDTSINLLVMNGKRIEKWASLPLEPGLVSQGLIVDEAQVAARVKQIFKETGTQASRVITAVSGHDSLYRIITLPELPDAILPEAVKREARRTIPTPLDEVYFSYQRLPTLTQGESRIFLATFPRNLVDALVRMLHQAGVKPYILDLAPLALCRIPNEPRAIILNARQDHLDVIVLADRLPQVIRRLSMPGETESLEEKMPLIAEEFHRTVAFYNSSHIEKPLDSTVPVFVCGDLAEAPETLGSVVGQSGNQVSPLPLPVEPPEGFNANEFLVNIGLAFKELLSAKEEANFSLVNFNALPQSYVPPRFSIARVILPVGIAVAVGLIIFGVIFIQINRAENRALNSQLTAAEASVAQLQKEIIGLKTQVNSAQAIAGELDSRITTMERERATIHEDLTQIVTLAQNNVTLGTVNHGGRSVSVQGVASSEDAIFQYARDLRSGGRFSRVWISSITQGQGGFNFSLSLTK